MDEEKQAKHIRHYNRTYYQKHRDGISLQRSNKRARDRYGEGNFAVLTPDSWAAVQHEFDGRCAMCGRARRLIPYRLTPFRTLPVCLTCLPDCALAVANDTREKRRNGKAPQLARS